MSRVEVRTLRKDFGAGPVLSGLDLSVPEGSITAILGSSGSGKSTLLRCIAGLLRPDAGSILLADSVVSGDGVWVAPQRRRVGLVPQEGSLFPHLSVADNVGFGLRGRDKGPRVAQMLELVGLPGAARMRPHELSGGMQQRVAVARALAPSPQVLLLDEPFSALDAGLRDEVRTDVFAAVRATGATAVLVTHDQQEALAVADQVAVMMRGTIAQAAPPDEVYRRPATLDVARFLGETVLLPATARGSDMAEGPFGALPVVNTAAPGTTGVVMLRPEDLCVGSGRPLMTAVVTDVRYHGHDSLVRARSGEQRLSVRLQERVVDIGEELPLGVLRPGIFFATAASRD